MAETSFHALRPLYLYLYHLFSSAVFRHLFRTAVSAFDSRVI